jgi:hypothetical protein
MPILLLFSDLTLEIDLLRINIEHVNTITRAASSSSSLAKVILSSIQAF